MFCAEISSRLDGIQHKCKRETFVHNSIPKIAICEPVFSWTPQQLAGHQAQSDPEHAAAHVQYTTDQQTPTHNEAWRHFPFTIFSSYASQNSQTVQME